MEEFLLNNGIKIPKLGLGTMDFLNAKGQELIYNAIKLGYRLLDTAQVYKNEEDVGIAVNKAIKDGLCTREELFITTKLNPHICLDYENTIKVTEESLKKLNLDYVDLLLIHRPRTVKDDRWKKINAETWRAMEDLVRSGKVKSIGVSNFTMLHLEELLKTAQIKPVINQIEFSPLWQQREIVNYCQSKDILVEAYFVMGGGKYSDNEKIQNLGKKYNKDIAQINIRYCLQNNVLPLSKSHHEERLKTNMEVFDFNITEDDMKILDDMNSNPQCGPADAFDLWVLYDQMNEQAHLQIRRKIKLFNLFTLFRTKVNDDYSETFYLLNFIPFAKLKRIDRYYSKFYLFGFIYLFTIKYGYKTPEKIEHRHIPEYK